MPATDKGKARALPRDAPGTPDGVVLSLDLVGSGVYDVVYTVPARIGQDAQSFSLQVDTGSSDLWVASNSCSTSSCSQTKGHTYNPASSARDTGVQFSISYLSGSASGPVVWDSVEIGGYNIEHQALAAATDVQDEPLRPNFNGILGLALPLNSIIAENITPVTNNAPDGAAWASNLFSITPTSSAPASRFLSLSLSRPGSNRIPSYLGIGKHPPDLISDPSQIHYSAVVSDRPGILFWKAGVRAITVYVDGHPRPIEVGRSNTGAVFPSAVLDSGVPFIFTTSTLANAIYGAIGVNPAADGQYYVPCKTPLNMTITLDDRPEFPLHPLDLTGEPPQDNKAEFCIGLIQAADPQLAHPGAGIGDMVLGVPFLRSTYTVMAYTMPNPDGSFTPANGSLPIRPRLGLMSLTDPTTALDEFNRVRILNQPLSSDKSSNGGSAGFQDGNGGKKLSVGIIVLVSLLGFFALCCGLFAIRWLLLQRGYRRQRERERQEGLTDDKRALAYSLARRKSNEFTGMPSEDTLRAMRYEAYMKKVHSFSSSSSSRPNTQTSDDFGMRLWSMGEDTLVDKENRDSGLRQSRSITSSVRSHGHSREGGEEDEDGESPEQYRTHRRTKSEMPDTHERTTSVVTPLLPALHQHHHLRHQDSEDHNSQQE